MRKTIQDLVSVCAYYLEILLSIILSLALFFFTFSLMMELGGFWAPEGDIDKLLQSFIGRAMALAVGVELIKMISKPSANTVLEVLLFAIARQMVVEHPTVFEFLLGILAVTLLFTIRKFLLHPNKAKPEPQQ